MEDELVRFIKWWYTYHDAANLGDLTESEIRRQYRRFKVWTAN